MKLARMRRAVLGGVVLALALVGPQAIAAESGKKKVRSKVVAEKRVVARKASARHTRRHDGDFGLNGQPAIRSSAALVIDQQTGEVIFEKNPDVVSPIASITKLMTAMVVLDSMPDLAENIRITQEDVDTLRGSSSRLRVGSVISREEALLLALMSSENRAAHALARHYPGGAQAFVSAMNAKAQLLGLSDTRFSDPTGLSSDNVSTPRDLARMVTAASRYPLIRELSTTAEAEVAIGGRTMDYRNTNLLVKSDEWRIGLSKTGYIREAGKCLVMQAWMQERPVVIVLLDSWGRLTRIGDANRLKSWLESGAPGRRGGQSA